MNYKEIERLIRFECEEGYKELQELGYDYE